MAVLLGELLGSHLDQLRFQPVAKRVRAEVGGDVLAESDRAVLVWEPCRVVPGYAVPEDDVRGAVTPLDGDPPADPGWPALDPRVPFGVHRGDGERVEVRVPGGAVEAFRPADPALAGLLVLDFAGPDRWSEEAEEIVSHPRDPFHRVDVRASDRHVRISLDGVVLAETDRPRSVFETSLPVRWYLPREDVRVPLRPSDTRTWCAYKGGASYWSAEVGDRVVADLAWSYEDPLPDATQLTGLVCFFDEKVDVEVDGVARDRPTTFWS
jgi:uncharacterized protein (DUF427 family)